MHFLKIFIFVIICFLFVNPSHASSLATKLSGQILLNVEKNGEAWYVNPADKKRYFLGRPSDAFSVMRELGVGISEYNFQKLVKEDMPDGIEGDIDFAKKLSGKILLQVERNGEAWYVDPSDLRLYYLGRPDDAFKVMREHSLGISRKNLALIHKPGFDENLDKYSGYEYKTLNTKLGIFKADIVTIDLNNPNLEIMTDTTELINCKTNCKANTLGDFVIEHEAFAAMNGTYFDTSSSKNNYYFFPVYNTKESIMINENQLKYWTTGPIMAFDTLNNFYYYKDSRDFKSVADFEKNTGSTLQAAIGNKPRLIENGLNQLIPWEVDAKQKNVKSTRHALAYKKEESGKGELQLIILHNSTVLDLAEVLKELEIDFALNMDGGYSSALWYNDEYMVGPGRNIPNAILFKSITD